MSFSLEIRRPGQAPQRVEADGGQVRVPAEVGATYRVDPSPPGRAVDAARVRRVDADLVVDGLEGDGVVTIERFFVTCTPAAACTLDVSPLAGAQAAPIDPSTVPVAALQDGSFVMLASPGALAPVAPADAESGISMRAVGLGLGVLALAGAGGGGGGGGGESADVSAPAAPVLQSGKETALAFPVIAGVAEAGSRVSVTLARADGSPVATWTVTADALGAWSIDSASAVPGTGAMPAGGLTPGIARVTARAVDAAGNVSELATQEIVIGGGDTGQSVRIDALVDDVPGLTGTLADGATTNDRSPEWVGSLAAPLALGERVRLTLDGAPAGEAVVDGTTWRFAVAAPIGDGAHDLVAQIVASDGTVLSASKPFALVVDGTAPARPTIDPIAGDDRVEPGEAVAGVVVAGGAEPGAALRVSIGSAAHTVEADAAGRWSVAFATGEIPASDSASALVVASDRAGNDSPSATRGFAIGPARAGPPPAPTITALADDVLPRTGTIGSGERTNDTTPQIQGTLAEPLLAGESLRVLRDGVDVSASGASVTVSGAQWQMSAPAVGGDGAYAFVAQVVGADGSRSGESNVFVYFLDRTAPASPVIDTVAGNNSVNNTEAARGVVVTGEAEAGSTVTVSWSASTTTVTRVVSADGGGDWSADFSDSLPGRGSTTVRAFATDEAGNVGQTRSRSVNITATVGLASSGGDATLKSADLLDAGADPVVAAGVVAAGSETSYTTGVYAAWGDADPFGLGAPAPL